MDFGGEMRIKDDIERVWSRSCAVGLGGGRIGDDDECDVVAVVVVVGCGFI